MKAKTPAPAVKLMVRRADYDYLSTLAVLNGVSIPAALAQILRGVKENGLSIQFAVKGYVDPTPPKVRVSAPAPTPKQKPHSYSSDELAALYEWHLSFLKGGDDADRANFDAVPNAQKMGVVLEHLASVGLTVADLMPEKPEKSVVDLEALEALDFDD